MAVSGRGGEANTAVESRSKRRKSRGKRAPRPGAPTSRSGERAPAAQAGSAETERRGQAAPAGKRRGPGTAAPCPGEGTMLPSQPGPRPRSCPRRGPGGQRGGAGGGVLPQRGPPEGEKPPHEAGPTPAGVPRAPLPPPPRRGRPEPRRAAGPPVPCRAPQGPVPTATAASASSFPPRHAAPTPAPLTGHGGVAAPPSLGQDGSRSEPNLRQRLYKVGRDLRRRRVSRGPPPRADYKSRRAPRWGPRACARWWRSEGPSGSREASAAGSSPPVRPGPGLGGKLAGTVLNKHSVPRLQVGSARALVGLSRAAGRRSGLVSLSQQPSRAGA